jgi:multicomponent Na+:H+ antiporter subunit A
VIGYLVLTPFLAALLAPVLVLLLGHRASWILALVPGYLLYRFFEFVPAVAKGETVLQSHEWLGGFGINYSFMIDGLSLTFAFLILGIGFFIVIYAGGYLKGHPQLGRFLAVLLAFMGSMLGLVVSDNLITLFVFWELTSITSFLLIGFDNEREASRRAALQALIITGLGGLVMLAGFTLIGLVGGTFELSELLSKGEVIKEHGLYSLIFWLVMAGAFTKSAQVPFHSWLPNAMEAPTPVSAYLHSATMVKAGVFLLMRTYPMLGETELWETVLPLFGGATLLAGTILAVRDKDMKLMLAYTTVASLGLLVLMLGVGGERAIEGAVLYLIAHSFFKGALFMVVGTVDHEAGTRQIDKLSGLRSAMPITALAAALAALSMCGLPPFIGFLAKESIYYSLTHGGLHEWTIAIVAIVGNALMFGVAASIAIRPFMGKWIDPPKAVHEGPVMLFLGPLVLSITGLVTAIFALQFMQTNFFSPMVSAVAGKEVTLDLHLWHGINPALILSVITVGLGIGVFIFTAELKKIFDKILNFISWGPDKGFDQAICFLTWFAGLFTRILQTGEIRTYMRITFLITALTLLVPMYNLNIWPNVPSFPKLSLWEIGVFVILVIGILQVVFANTRLTAIISLGIQGFSVALIFMLFGAPDLSFTQFMVETLSVVIIALVLTRLQLMKQDRRSSLSLIFDGVVAISVGVGMGALLMNITQLPLDMRLSEFFSTYSAAIAHGRNIVNVILVDFRAIDTLGEITVVLITGVSALALIRVKAIPEKKTTKGSPALKETS